MQPGGGLGVIQPQIMFGYDCVEGVNDSGIGPWINATGRGGLHHLGDRTYKKDPYFYWSAQYVYDQNLGKPGANASWVCATGELFKATEGEKLITQMWYDPVVDGWHSVMISPDTGRQSKL
jgi:hypothetical protein